MPESDHKVKLWSGGQ